MQAIKRIFILWLMMILGTAGAICAQKIPTPTVLIIPAVDADNETWVQYAVQLRKKRPELFAGAQGVLITEIVKESQAEKHGLQRGDIIIAYNGQQINTVEKFLEAIQNNITKTQIEMQFIRADTKLTIVVQGGKIGVQVSNIPDEKHLELDRLIQEGTDAYYAADYQTALKKWGNGLEQARTLNNKPYISKFLNNLGLVYDDLGEYQQARKSCEQALAIARQIADRWMEGLASTNLGNVYVNVGEYHEALRYYEQSLAIARENGNRQGEGSALTNIGSVYRDIGQYQDALRYYKQALAIDRELGDRRGEGIDLDGIGMVYDSLGQYQESLHYYEQALAIKREIGDRRGEGHTLNNIGVTYDNLRRYEDALQTYKQAVVIASEIGNREGEGSALGNIGIIYKNLGLFQEALRYHEQALAIARELGNRRGEETALTNMGIVYDKLGQYREALPYYEQALVIDREIGDLEGVWITQCGLATVEVKLEQPESAITHYEQALETIEQLRAELNEKEHKISFIQGKLYVYDELISLLQNLQVQSPNGYNRKAFETFERKQGRMFLEEMGKSGARLFGGLPENIFQQEIDLENQIEQTRKLLVDERSKKSSEQNQERIRNLEEREKTLQAEQEALQSKMKTDYPDYYALRYPKPVALVDLQQQVLQPGEMLLAYHVMQDQTVLWAISQQDFLMLPLNLTETQVNESVTAFRQVQETLSQDIQKGKPIMRTIRETLPGIMQQGAAFYQQFFPEQVRPLLADAQRLYIVPTGALYGLPFEAFVTDISNADGSPHYLIEDHAITYLSSASLLKILRDAQARRKPTTLYPLLAFANPVYPETTTVETAQTTQAKPAGADSLAALRDEHALTMLGGEFRPLPQTETQARTIADLLQAPAASGPLQVREQASEATVYQFNTQQRLDDYQYVLFATHGVIPEDGKLNAVDQPALVLSNPKHADDPAQDGYLTMAEAFTLSMNADLVVLSACNTGRGADVRGEGVMGLTRAFMYAGTPAVAVSLWEMNTEAANELNLWLFKNLKDGQPLAEALRQAKLDLLKAATENEDLEYFQHPFFWTPFVVFGDGR